MSSRILTIRPLGQSARVLGAMLAAVWLIANVTPCGYAQPTPPATRDITDREISTVMDLVMQARPKEALAHLDSLESLCAGQPLFLITRGRVLIEFIPIADHKKDYTKAMSEPALAVFDEVIDVCSRRLDDDDLDPDMRLYRGWSWMQKSHIRARGRSFYTAGRDAGRGKSDLEKYLRDYPDHASANGLLGAFLYFTDAIPSIFKFLSKLMFLPTGDRDRGLDMMDRALRTENPFGIDYVQLLSYVYVFFEGRYEEGLQEATELVDRFPLAPRPISALAVAAPFAPLGHARYAARVEAFISELEERDPQEVPVGALNMARATRAYAVRFLGNPDDAVDRFERIVANSPERPDWTESFAQFQLGQLYIGAGRIDDARDMLRRAIDNDKCDLFRKPARKVLEDLEEYGAAPDEPAATLDGRWIDAIYTADPDSLAAIATRCAALAPASLPAAFYLGECYLLSGHTDAALDAYQAVVQREVPVWLHAYQMIAYSRLAEIAGMSGDYERAVDHLERALDFYQDEYRVDWLLEGRRHYFERLGKGEGHAPAPTLLSLPD